MSPEKKHPFDYQILNSGRKSISIEIRPEGTVLVRAPFHTRRSVIDTLLTEKEGWILTHLEKMKKRQAEYQNTDKLSQAQLDALFDQALEVIPKKAAYYASLAGVTYGRITIRNQRTRWGSCSSIGNLNFNCLLMLAPDRVIDYVVVHELCHRLEMNHSRAFWECVSRIMPDYEIHRTWLKEHGASLMARMP